MKNKEKQVEEMAKDCCKSLLHCCMCDDCNYKEISNLDECKSMRIAENLVKKGYRKIPKDSVVLSREQFKILCEDKIEITHLSIDEEFKKECEYEIKQARKDKAEKCIRLIKETFFTKEALCEFIAKQFGVDLGE